MPPENQRPVSRRPLRAALEAVGTALPAVMIFVAVLSIPLSGAPALGLSKAQLASWLVVLYAVPGLLGLWIALHHRQPVVLTGNVFAIILFASLGQHVPFAELIGGAIVAGFVVALIGVFGLTARLAEWIPSPIVAGLLAGAVVPFVVRIFGAMNTAPLIVGGALVAYLIARRFMGPVYPILAALVTGVVIAGFSRQLGPVPAFGLPDLVVTTPVFTLAGLAAVTPVAVVIMTLQANLPSITFMRTQGYEPPVREIDLVSGLGTMAASVLGPTAISMPLPVTPIVAGPDAGDASRRFHAAIAAGLALVLIGLITGIAVGLPAFLSAPLLQALAGLALVGVLAGALKQMTAGPLLLGPLFAFVIAQSSLSLLGLGPLFWGLVAGVVVSRVLERDAVPIALRDAARPA